MYGSSSCLQNQLEGSYHHTHLTGNQGGGFFAPGLTDFAQRSFLAINLLSFPCSRGLEALYFCGIAFFLVSPGTLIKTQLLSVSGLSAIETGCCPSLLLAIASFCQEMTLVHFWFYFYFLPHPPPSTRLIFLKNRNQIMLHPFVNSPVTSIGSVYIWSGKQLHLYFC